MAQRIGRIESAIVKNATKVKKYNVTKKALIVGVILLAVILSITYIITVLYNKFGSFTVMVDKFDSLDYGLTLSPTPDFQNKATRLNCHAQKEITNISVTSLPRWLDNVDGEHNGDNYVACTFYCKNIGKKTVDYIYNLYIENMTKDIEKAIRVRLYVNGASTDYAYPRTDGHALGAEPNTVKFYEDTTITIGSIKQFNVNDVTKYTVVIWLEGDDPDCIDAIIGGKFKIDMQISVSKVYD